MSLALTEKFGVSGRRSFWLRCFLGGVIWALVFCAGPNLLASQLDIPGPEHLTHVEGQVVNSGGHPVANVEVTLAHDDKVAYRTRTDQAGEFRFEHASGRYTFRVARSEYAPAVRDIVVTEELVTRVEHKKLYVILGPGACADECSAVVTSKREFEREIREKNKSNF